MNARAEWKWARTPAERHALQLRGTGDYRIDGTPLAFAGDPPGTALANLTAINDRRATLGLESIVIVNTKLSLPAGRTYNAHGDPEFPEKTFAHDHD